MPRTTLSTSHLLSPHSHFIGGKLHYYYAHCADQKMRQ